jgi:hypothetical protein
LYVESLNDKQVAELEPALRPNQSSTSGFLDATESLRESAAKKNRQMTEWGLTHNKLVSSTNQN